MKKFKTESKKLLDLMINSVYTNQEIFLRELISNASDAVDKLHFMSLTDKNLDFSKESFEINVSFDKDARTIIISDNGVGMTKDDLDANLGTIAHSDSMLFKDENDEDQGNKLDIIGQFGVGFYSVFMVAKKVEVISRSYLSKASDKANRWTSDGIEGYSITEATRDSRGTDVIVHLKDDTKDNNYSEFLDEYKLQELIKQYSNYVRYPIKMEVTKSREKEKPADAGDDYAPEYEDYKEVDTINSMVPIWKRQKSKVKQEEYNEFYKSQFHDYQDPAATISIHAEGVLEYDALIFIPSVRPYDMYTTDYKKGLTLYSSNVLIMDKCEELVPDYFDFLRGVVDSQDLTLNISRETLQHNSQLRAIAKKIEGRVKKELIKLQEKDREKYEQFSNNFGRSLKFHIYQSYGSTADDVQDLLMFYSAKNKKLQTFNEYVDAADTEIGKESAKEKLEKLVDGKESTDSSKQEEKSTIYYAAGDNLENLAKMPVVQTVLDKGMDVFLCTDNVDDFCMSALRTFKDHPIKNVSSGDLGLESKEEKEKAEQVSEKNKDLFDAMKKALGDKVTKVAVATTPTDSPVRLIAEGPISFDMERTLANMPNTQDAPKATRVLEINPKHKVFKTLQNAQKEGDSKKIKLYSSVLYDQALLVENLPIDDPVEYAKNVTKLMI